MRTYTYSGPRAHSRTPGMPHLGAGPKIEDVIALSQGLAPLGMHLQVRFESALIHELAPWFRKSSVPVVNRFIRP